MNLIKIVSDGTGPGTRILDEAGNRIDGVTVIDWHISWDSVATATLQFHAVPVEVVAEVPEPRAEGSE